MSDFLENCEDLLLNFSFSTQEQDSETLNLFKGLQQPTNNEIRNNDT